MVKYYDRNYHDNAVMVDFLHKTIEFTPRNKYTAFSNQASFFLGGFIILFCVLAHIAIFTLINAYIIRVLNMDPLLQKLSFIIAGLSVIMGILMVLFINFSGDKGHEYYPKIMYFSQKWGVLILSLGLINLEKTQKILPKDVTQDYYILNKFYNVKISYELYGDFKDIQSISIDKIRIDDDEWYAFFKFNKPVKNGHMIIKYY